MEEGKQDMATTLSVRGNSNYAALIHAYDPANEVVLPNRDRVVGYKVAGYQSIVQKGSFLAGDPVIVFGAETQVSHDYAHHNNLYRHEHLNANPAVKGYLDDSRRVRAIKLGGNRSDALVMPAYSLFYLKEAPPEMVQWQSQVGKAFDHLNDHEICRKYVVKVASDGRSMAAKQGQKKTRVLTEFFPEHIDTENYFRNVDRIPAGEHVVVTQKLHGTSVRIGNVPVKRELKWYERLAKRFGVKVEEREFQVVVGSRRVTKSIGGEAEGGKNHYYAAGDLWTEATQGMGEKIPHGFLVFAEVIGWSGTETPVQPGYTYNVPRGNTAVYIYRVAVVNDQGDVVDLPWRAVQRFAIAREWNTVPQLWSGRHADFNVDAWLDVRYRDVHEGAKGRDSQFAGWYDETPVALSDNKSVDEGVVVRADTGFTPVTLKAKSPIFLGHETKLADQEVVDIESLDEAEVPA